SLKAIAVRTDGTTAATAALFPALNASEVAVATDGRQFVAAVTATTYFSSVNWRVQVHALRITDTLKLTWWDPPGRETDSSSGAVITVSGNGFVAGWTLANPSGASGSEVVRLETTGTRAHANPIAL